jgi:hypothetical protein
MDQKYRLLYSSYRQLLRYENVRSEIIINVVPKDSPQAELLQLRNHVQKRDKEFRKFTVVILVQSKYTRNFP